ncbi:quinoprotein dehydrogenase-associated SoxYZ-like carrier [Amaricoccus macauensis]|uniref:quinoprotein dehydrogenase-associated SoxYZ-like carrier n=1 Tax=Amaricoccus macauensis TaxID=57001 RepID=UPI003C7E2C47
MSSRTFSISSISCLALALAGSLWAAEPARDNPLVASESWDLIRDDLVGDVELLDGEDVFDLGAPYRAADAATVPITLRQTNDTAGPIEMVRLVIDENPAPLAADISFGPAMQPLDFEMRVRVNQYSNVRAIAETPDGHFMTGRFVKASGGCSAPASKSPEEALAGMGEMRLRLFGVTKSPQVSKPRQEAQIMIRHPNYSGLQRDQITQLFIGAHFLDRIEVLQGDERLFLMEGGISISENPVFRFNYADNGAESLRIIAHDTEGNTFEKTLPKVSPS